jgi:hypothetical protein
MVAPDASEEEQANMLTYADVSSRMLMYAEVCWFMLTYADAADVAAGGMVVPDASEAEEQAFLADDMLY